MPIPGVCPSCGVKFDLVQALVDGEARQALVAALDMPKPLASLVIPYMSLHAPQGRAMAWSKLTRLLRELTEMVTSAKVARKGMTYTAPQELWKAGIEETLSARDAGSLILPLDGHGYLTEVVWRMAAKSAGKYEREKEERGRFLPGNCDEDGKAKTAGGHLKNQLKNLRQLQAQAPNDAIAEQIAELEQKLKGDLNGE